MIKQGAASVLIQAVVLCDSHGVHHSDTPGNFTPSSTSLA